MSNHYIIVSLYHSSETSASKNKTARLAVAVGGPRFTLLSLAYLSLLVLITLH